MRNYTQDLWGWPLRNEIVVGLTLLPRIFPACRLYLYGHRHEPREERIAFGDQWVIFHNGATPAEAMNQIWMVTHDNGQIVKTEWIPF
jgi:hypothetical protein